MKSRHEAEVCPDPGGTELSEHGPGGVSLALCPHPPRLPTAAAFLALQKPQERPFEHLQGVKAQGCRPPGNTLRPAHSTHNFTKLVDSQTSWREHPRCQNRVSLMEVSSLNAFWEAGWCTCLEANWRSPPAVPLLSGDLESVEVQKTTPRTQS